MVTVAPYKPVAKFIKLAHQVNFNAVFVAISFVGSDALAKELAGDGAGVIVSQVVPFPRDPSLPVVASYQAALFALDRKAKPNFVSLEGYLVGRLVVETLKRLPGEPTREGFLDADRQGTVRLWGRDTQLSGRPKTKARIRSILPCCRPMVRSSRSRGSLDDGATAARLGAI